MKKFAWILPAVALTASIVLTGCASADPGASSGAGSSAAAAGSSPVAATAAKTMTKTKTKTFTLSELRQYNGRNGKPAYIAVSGIVYDVTNVKGWSGGTHHGYSAGQDLTAAIRQSPHGTSVLQSLPVVGKLQ
jgi:predicted heme/steroid binding protein